MIDQPAEEDAFYWHHYPGCQSHGHSRVHQSLQGGVQFGWANLHHVQTRRPEQRHGDDSLVFLFCFIFSSCFGLEFLAVCLTVRNFD